jgi:hypothetical protein
VSPSRSWLLALVAATAGPGCGHTIIDKPVHQAGDSWELTMRKLVSGPNQCSPTPRSTAVPGADRRFIFVHITLHNTQRVARKFNFDRCDLDDGQQRVVPSYVDIDAFITGATNREPELAADETITRQLIFSYPEKRSPTRLNCVPMVIPLPQF